MAKLVTWAIVLGLVVLVSTGFAYNVYKQRRCPGHWHGAFEVYVDGARVSFNHPQFQFESAGRYPGNSMPPSSHVHNSDDFEWHFEPNPSSCIRFGDVTRFVGMDLQEGTLKLDQAHSDIPLQGTNHTQGGVYANEGNRTLHAYHQVDNGVWEEIGISDLEGRQLRDGEKVLILYGDYTPKEVADLQGSMPAPPTYVRQVRAEGRQPNYLSA